LARDVSRSDLPWRAEPPLDGRAIVELRPRRDDARDRLPLSVFALPAPDFGQVAPHVADAGDTVHHEQRELGRTHLRQMDVRVPEPGHDEAPRFLVDRGAGRDCIAATRYRELADAVEAMAVGDTDEERRARWLVWLRAYVTRVEQEVVRELPDPERGPKPHWSY